MTLVEQFVRLVGMAICAKWVLLYGAQYIDVAMRFAVFHLVKLLQETVVREDPPQPPQPIPEPEPEPTYFDFLDEYVEKLQAIVSLKTATIVGLTILLGCIIMYLSRMWLRRVVLSLRGIRFEAMQCGSTFMIGTIPGFQVEIYNMGTFADTFIGYGTRIGGMLVIPRHVASLATVLLVKGKKGKMPVTLTPIMSRVQNDIAYYPLTDAQWADLGTIQANVPRQVTNALVSCYGQKGVSNGMLTRSDVVGILRYSGSTLPGMSGAPYAAGNVVHGVHIGVTGTENIGVSAVQIFAELQQLRVGETPNQAELTNKVYVNRVGSGWDTTFLTKNVASAYEEDRGWAAQQDFNYDLDLGLSDSESGLEAKVRKMMELFNTLPIQQREAGVNAMMNMNLAARTAKGQGAVEEEIQLPKDFVTQRFEAIEKRLDLLEAKKSPVKPAVPKEYKCGFNGCTKSCDTTTALAVHQVMVGHVRGESAFSADVTKVVKTDKVFPKTAHSQQTSGQPLKTTLKSSATIKASTSAQDTQSQILESLKNMQKGFAEMQQVMVGLSSAITQNSAA
ncbi:hypothetical protein [Myrmica rubra virus 7]|nr:hypothetical protein [Myrmica rubra virus 7]